MTTSIPQAITALIPCYNNADIIARCLDSVTWADEILLCDSFSSDETLAIAAQYGVRVIQREYGNSASQKNWAIPQAAHSWVLLVDTDEVITPELAQEIQTFLRKPPAGVDACRIARRNTILDRWIPDLNLWPDYVTRLFRQDAARYEEKEVHADIRVPGQLHTFQQPLIHYGTPHWSKQIVQLDRYTRYQADEWRKQGRRFSWLRTLTRPPAAFLYYYFVKRGYRHGMRGFFLSVHAAVYSFYTYAKLWEIEEMNLERSPR